MVSEAAEAAPATRWGIVLLVFGAGVVAAFQVGKAPAAIPTLRAELGLSLIAAGWVISIFNVIGAAVGMMAGAAADRLGHRRVTLIGFACVAISSLLGGLAPNAAAILASRFIEGLGFISIVVAVPSLIIRAARPGDLRLAFGIWSGYMPAGTAMIILVSPLILEPFGWRGLWVGNAALVAAFALVLAALTRSLARPAQRADAGSVSWRDMGRTLTAGGPLLLALTFATYAGNFLSVIGFLPTFLIEQRGLASGEAAALTALVVVVNVPGNLFGGWLLHRDVPRWVLIMTASLAMGLASLAIYSAGVPDAVRLILCVLFSFIGGIIPAAVIGGAPVFAPTPALVATTNGLIMQGANLGQMIGPPAVAALVAASGGWERAPAVVVASAALGVLLALRVRRIERGAGG